MTDKMKPQQDLDEAMLTLREEYEQTAAPIEEQPEPKQGKELKGRRFPKVISYMMGAAAVMMLVAAVFLFNMQNGSTEDVLETGVADVAVGSAVETAVDPVTNQPIPTLPLLVAPPPPPQGAIPLPPEPTPWPTPPIAPDS
jgi:hypothetical protein